MARNLRLSPCSFAQLVLLISKSLRETLFFDISTLLALTLNYSNLNPFLRWPLSCGRESILRYKISRKSEQRWVSISKESVKVLKYTAIADRKSWMVCNFFFSSGQHFLDLPTTYFYVDGLLSCETYGFSVGFTAMYIRLIRISTRQEIACLV